MFNFKNVQYFLYFFFYSHLLYYLIGKGEMGNYKNGLETKNNIYYEARKSFIKKGYGSTTLRDISDALDIRLSLINYYYGSKENLAFIIFKDYTNEIDLAIKELFDSENVNSLQERIYYDISSYMAYFECFKSVPELGRFYADICSVKGFSESLKDIMKYYTDNTLYGEYGADSNPDLSDPDYYEIIHTLLAGMEIELMKSLFDGKLEIDFDKAVNTYLAEFYRHLFADFKAVKTALKRSRKVVGKIKAELDEDCSLIISLR